MPSHLFQAGKLSDYEYPDHYSKYWMKITKEVECNDIFNPKPYWTEEGLSFDNIWDEGLVQGHKDLKVYPVIWACWGSGFWTKESLTVLK